MPRMHQIMDAMMGEGHSEAMHAAMPGYEEMMEACAGALHGTMNDGGMMSGTNRMMRDGH